MAFPNRKLVVQPVVEPVSLTELAHHTVLGADDIANEADYLKRLITAARSRFEQRTSRLLVEQQWQLGMSCFFSQISIPMAPLREVVSIQYYDKDGTLHTLDSGEYIVNDYGIHAKITPVSSWPATVNNRLDAVKITVKVGHASVTGNKVDATTINDKGTYEQCKQAIMILVADWYKNREDTAAIQLHHTPNAFNALCAELSVDLL